MGPILPSENESQEEDDEFFLNEFDSHENELLKCEISILRLRALGKSIVSELTVHPLLARLWRIPYKQCLNDNTNEKIKNELEPCLASLVAEWFVLLRDYMLIRAHPNLLLVHPSSLFEDYGDSEELAQFYSDTWYYTSKIPQNLIY